MDKNTGQLPEGVKWPCYEDGTPVKFGDVIKRGPGHFPAKSFRFRESGWVIYDAELAATAKQAKTGGYGDFVTRYIEPDSWDKWRKDAINLVDNDACAYFGKEAMAWLAVSAALFALLWLALTAASCASDAALSLMA